MTILLARGDVVAITNGEARRDQAECFSQAGGAESEGVSTTHGSRLHTPGLSEQSPLAQSFIWTVLNCCVFLQHPSANPLITGFETDSDPLMSLLQNSDDRSWWNAPAKGYTTWGFVEPDFPDDLPI